MKALDNRIGRICNSFKNVALATSVLCAVVMTSSLAVAAPIGNASFGIGGAFTLPSGSNLGNTNALFIANGGQIFVTASGTGDLSGIVNFGQLGSLQDLPSFSGFTPIAGFINLPGSGVLVNLGSFNITEQTGNNGGPGFLNVTGSAVIIAPGFDPTPGTLTLTGTTSAHQSFTLAITTAANTPDQGVPEPLSLGLLGLGLLGMFGIARRRNNSRDTV